MTLLTQVKSITLRLRGVLGTFFIRQ